MKAEASALSTAQAAVDVHDVVVRYDTVLALDRVSLSVNRGTALGIVGPNGSGKSTLLKTVAGLIRPDSGSVRAFGVEPRRLPPGTIGYVPQIEEVDFSFPVNVRDVVSMGRYARLRPFEPFGAADRRAVNDAIEALDLGPFANRHIAELSGGQQQRVFVARAIAQAPELMLLDEPTTGVDAATEEALLHLVRRLVADGMPVLMTTHDLERATDWFDRLVVVDHRIVADGRPAAVLASGAYTSMRGHQHTHGHVRSDHYHPTKD